MTTKSFNFKKTAASENSNGALLDSRIEQPPGSMTPTTKYSEPDTERGRWFYTQVLTKYGRGHMTLREAVHTTARGLRKWYDVRRPDGDTPAGDAALVRYDHERKGYVPCGRHDIGALCERHLHEFATAIFCQEVRAKLQRRTVEIEEGQR